MTYQDFLTTVTNCFRQEFPENTRVELQKITKNNGAVYDGISVFSGGINISPTIYLNSYYERYKQGTSIDFICKELIRLYRKLQPVKSMDLSYFTDFEKAKGNIVYRLINYQKNSELLADVPYTRFLDLARVYYCFLPQQTKDACATVLIRRSHLKHWGIDIRTLHKTALANTPKRLSWQLIDLQDMITPFLMQNTGPSCSETDDDPAMYVLTNSDRQYGASVLCYKNLLPQLADEFQSDFVILPSSVHEVILIPSDLPEEPDGINSIISEINRTQLAAEEVLSDHAYFYSRDEGLQRLV